MEYCRNNAALAINGRRLYAIETPVSDWMGTDAGKGGGVHHLLQQVPFLCEIAKPHKTLHSGYIQWSWLAITVLFTATISDLII